jgi:ribose 5-phosphate isomerase A
MDLRQLSALRALDEVRNGMTLGLGSGRTAAHFIDSLGQKLQAGELSDVRGVPTSEASAARARQWGIPLVSLASVGELDLAVDGADEVDPALNLIKGLGHALLREKIVEIHARRLVIVVDEGKLSPRLGLKCPVPVEILPFEAEVHLRWLDSLGSRAEYYRHADGSLIQTDNGNLLALCWFDGGIPDPGEIAHRLAERPGVVEHGLFLGMADRVIVAGVDGIRTLERNHEL